MAEFGANQTQVGEVQDYSTVKEPVVKQPVFLQGMADLFNSASGLLKDATADRAEQTVSKFRGDLLSVVQGVDQGIVTPQAARSKMRLLLMQRNEQYGKLGSQLTQVYQQVLGMSGMGEVIPEALRDQIRRDKVVDSLYAQGWIKPGASAEDEEAALSEFATVEAAKRKYDAQMQTFSLQTAAAGRTAAESQARQSMMEKASRDFVFSAVPALSRSMSNQAEDLRKKVNSGEISAQEAEAMFQNIYQSGVEELMSNGDGGAGPLANMSEKDRSLILSTFEDRYEMELRKLTGQLDLESYEREIKAMDARNQLVLMSDPEVSRFYSWTKANPSLAPALISRNPSVINRVSNLFNQGFDEDGNSTNEGKQVFGSDQTSTTEFLNLLANDEIWKDAPQEQAQHLAKVLSGITEGEGVIRNDPLKGKALVKFLSSQKFLDVRNKYPEMFNNVDEAVSVIQQHYADEVYGAVKREFTNKGISYSDSPRRRGRQEEVTEPAPNQITAEVIDTGIGFTSLSDNPQIQAEVIKLNKELAPIINQTLKATAHLQGSTNYKKEAENILNKMFESQGDDELAGGDAEDDLSIDQLTLPQISVNALPKAVQEDTEFMSGIQSLSQKYDLDPSVLLGIMDFETGGSFSPSQKNAAGSSGTGLIQFMAKTAKGLGTSTKELSKMSRVEQLEWVEKYLDQYEDKIRGGDAADVYMSVLYPVAIDKPDSYVLFRSGTKAYAQNKGLDKNKDGTVTKAEAARKVRERVSKHET